MIVNKSWLKYAEWFVKEVREGTVFSIQLIHFSLKRLDLVTAYANYNFRYTQDVKLTLVFVQFGKHKGVRLPPPSYAYVPLPVSNSKN